MIPRSAEEARRGTELFRLLGEVRQPGARVVPVSEAAEVTRRLKDALEGRRTG